MLKYRQYKIHMTTFVCWQNPATANYNIFWRNKIINLLQNCSKIPEFFALLLNVMLFVLLEIWYLHILNYSCHRIIFSLIIRFYLSDLRKFWCAKLLFWLQPIFKLCFQRVFLELSTKAATSKILKNWLFLQ